MAPWLGLVLWTAATFLPALIALWRHHHNRLAIIAMNVIAFLMPIGCGAATVAGWVSDGAPVEADIESVSAVAMGFGVLFSIPFWLGALIWSLTSVRRE